jgi:peptidoglycan/LPS O-acetylase OafA/YrhL
VLSGYLITSILLRELEQTADISMFNFYRRRFLRLTPPLLTLAAFQFAHAALSPHNGAEIVKATLIGMSYTENFNIAFPFGPGEFMKHTWSLATEEQFYLLWPLALPFIVSRRPLVWLACGSAGRLAWSIWLLIHGATLEHIKYGADSRPIGLLVGCALAFIPAKRWPTIPPALAFGLVAALFAVSAAGHDAMIAG